MAAPTTFRSSASSTRPPVPLMTIFTPPASCLDVVTFDGTSLWQGGLRQTGDAGCYPSGFYRIFNSYYTPGICPNSWTSVGSVTDVRISTGYDAMCCPSSYFLFKTTTGILQNACASLVSEDLTNVWSTSKLEAGPLPPTHPLTTIKKSDIQSNTVWADVIQVRWNDGNSRILSLLSATTTSSSRASGSRGAAPPSGLPVGQPTGTSAPGQAKAKSSGLSSGAEAGIGIGAAAVAVIIAVLAFLFIRNRRRKAKGKQPYIEEQEYKPPGYYELAEHENGQKPPVEIDNGGFVGELPATDMQAGQKQTAELDSSNVVRGRSVSTR